MTTTHAFRPQWQAKNLCAFEFEDESVCLLERVRHQYELQPKIEIEVWKPNPKAEDPDFAYLKGTVVVDYRRKVQDVLDELNAKLKAEGLEPDEYGFSNMTKYDDAAYMEEGSRKYTQYSLPWPKARRIAVFPVTGGSEGHYIHVEVILDSEELIRNGGKISIAPIMCIGLAKTFQGWDHACRISAAAARLLQA